MERIKGLRSALGMSWVARETACELTLGDGVPEGRSLALKDLSVYQGGCDDGPGTGVLSTT